uniref:Fucolectin tachylectin-4 pentraxin-1 domain-containing protein n=1 Tax=Sparus aurata TaxID=8175 RepID=A0A671TX55_SPAAU
MKLFSFSSDLLILLEVEKLPSPPRIGKVVPERAIDGSRASNWHQGSCTHTQKDKNPWWRLDLLRSYKVNTVTITNRKDCCHERINGAEIRIGYSLENYGNANPRCAVITSISRRYVNIVIPGRREFLTLCEVEVTGQPYGKKAPLVICNI